MQFPINTTFDLHRAIANRPLSRLPGNRDDAFRMIAKAVADHCNVPADFYTTPSRHGPLARARKVMIALCKHFQIEEVDKLKMGYTWLAEQMGGRDHSTIVNAYKSFRTLRDVDPDVEEPYKALCLSLGMVYVKSQTSLLDRMK